MKKLYIAFGLCSVLCALCSAPVGAAPFPSQGSPGVLSQYGQIQNVQGYSSNPFWTPGSPYNQRMPTPVYAQGTELNAGECRGVVSGLVARHCSLRGSCANAKLTDIKPAVMISLSQMTGHNYVSACGGFIDTIFDEYVAAAGGMTGSADFPTAVVPGSNAPQPEFKIKNPYAPGAPAEWKQEEKKRAAELDKLQTQNGGTVGPLQHTDMPKTYADLSFEERMANTKAGLEEWQCDPKTGRGCAYQGLKIEDEDKAQQRKLAAAEAAKAELEAKLSAEYSADPKKFCKDHPTHAYCTATTVNTLAPTTTVASTTAAASTTPAAPLIDVKNDPKYKDVYGLLITESPWFSWGAPLIGTVASLAVLGVGGFIAGPVAKSMYQMKNGEDVGKLPDWGSDWKGCFNLCGEHSDGNDMLSMKVIRPVLGGADRYCIQKDLYYTLYNMTREEPVFFTKAQSEQIKAKLPLIADNGFCDGHFNDADAYIVKYTIDSASVGEGGKQELNYIINIASEPIRIDD